MVIESKQNSVSCYDLLKQRQTLLFFSSLLKDSLHLLAPDRLAVLVPLVVKVHQVVYRVPCRNYDDGSISYVVFLHFYFLEKLFL